MVVAAPIAGLYFPDPPRVTCWPTLLETRLACLVLTSSSLLRRLLLARFPANSTRGTSSWRRG